MGEDDHASGRWRTWDEIEAEAKAEGRLDETQVDAERGRLREEEGAAAAGYAALAAGETPEEAEEHRQIARRPRLRLSGFRTAGEIHEQNMRDDPEYRREWEREEREERLHAELREGIAAGERGETCDLGTFEQYLGDTEEEGT